MTLVYVHTKLPENAVPCSTIAVKPFSGDIEGHISGGRVRFTDYSKEGRYIRGVRDINIGDIITDTYDLSDRWLISVEIWYPLSPATPSTVGYLELPSDFLELA